MRFMSEPLYTPPPSAYTAARHAESLMLPVRNIQVHALRWAPPASNPALAPLVMVHGWMDVGASFQFVVDAFSNAFAQGRTIMAPDWRGYGHTSGTHSIHAADNYWFPDYMADLDFLLDALFPAKAVDLVGHSMGGNVSMVYAGVRPERIRRLINLEGFGMPRTEAAQAPTRYAKWMDELKALHRGEMALKPYASAADVARRLMKNNPRLAEGKAHWLAQRWAAPNAQGQWQVLGNPAHKVVNATLSRVDEALACYARITAPTLAVVASHSEEQFQTWWQGRYSMSEFKERLKTVPQLTHAQIADAGHMLHHDQPEALAAVIERFLA